MPIRDNPEHSPSSSLKRQLPEARKYPFAFPHKPFGYRAPIQRLIIAEGIGRIAIGIPNGDNVAITTIKEGGMDGGTPGVTVTKGMAWAIEGKLCQRDANNPDADKGLFRLFPVSLPK